MKIPKQNIIDIQYGHKINGEVLEDKIIDHTRWSVVYLLTFNYKGKNYQTTYRAGATEYQDESPFDLEPEEIECNEVHQVERLVKIWENI